MITPYYIYKPGFERTTHSVDWPQNPSLAQIKMVVEPIIEGDIEHVSVLFEGQPADMFVDEDGHAKKLPLNREATKIYRANWLSRNPGTNPETLAAVHGTAVVFNRPVWS